MKLSKWTYNTDQDFDGIIENMLSYPTWWVHEVDPLSGENLLVEIKKVFDDNQKIMINGNEIQYNYIDYSYEKVRPGEANNEMRSTRIFSQKGFLIVYTDGTSIQIITDRASNAGTKTILRKINNCSKNLEIVGNINNISEDTFIWTIYKVLESGENSLDEDSELLIEKIIGFKGATDELAEVIGTGSTIMNLLSTLAFLFENETVSIIQPRINYNNNTIDLKLETNGNIELDFNTYIGDYLLAQEPTRYSSISLITMLEIIPKFSAAYLTDVENGDWSKDKKVEFFTDMGTKIQEKIQEKLNK